jgi:CheY-like chemotaxis protein
MWAESTPGQGSCFSFTLRTRPVATAAATPGPAQNTEAALDGRFARRYPARVLVAEDNPVNQRVVVRLLEKLGYQATVAQNGREAVAALHAQPFDVVLMDVEMPEMDGPTATQTLRREFPPERQPVVIAVTAHAMAGHRDELLAVGMNDYLAKPIRLAELAALFRRLDEFRPRTAPAA